MVNPYEPPGPDPPVKSNRNAAFWVLLLVEAVIAIGTIAPCCVVVHFNGLTMGDDGVYARHCLGDAVSLHRRACARFLLRIVARPRLRLVLGADSHVHTCPIF